MGYGFGNRIAVGRRAITAQAQSEQIVWKVAVFGAGTPTSNGEYVWDGTTLYNGKPVYSKDLNTISWDEFSSSGIFEWGIYDDDISFTSYVSYDLISWSNDRGDGTSPAPSSTLSYAQNSFISSLTLAGAGTTSSNGIYARSSDGTETPFISGSNQIFYDAGRWVVEDNVFGDFVYESDGTIFNWTVFNGDSPAPTVSAIVYSA